MKRVLKTTLAFCLMFCFAFCLTACGNEGNEANTNNEEASFQCASLTFVYDSWSATGEVSEDDEIMINAMMQVNYGHTQFVFDADGNSCVWSNTQNEVVTLSGSWQIVGETVVVTRTDLSTETLYIDGVKFYVVQEGGTYDLHIYFKLGV